MLKIYSDQTLLPQNKIPNNGIQHTHMSYNMRDKIETMKSEKKGTYREAGGRGVAWHRKGKEAFMERTKRWVVVALETKEEEEEGSKKDLCSHNLPGHNGERDDRHN